jgi:hypothetical protein
VSIGSTKDKDIDKDDWGIEVTVKRKGMSPVVSRFTVGDAKRANLWEKAGPWKQYPRRMMEMRARGFALRTAFADVLNGIHLTEEIEPDDLRNMKTVSATVTRPPTSTAFLKLPKTTTAEMPTEEAHHTDTPQAMETAAEQPQDGGGTTDEEMPM